MIYQPFHYSLYFPLSRLLSSLPSLSILCLLSLLELKTLHCAKNHISQVLEYRRKLKKTTQISSFHQLFGWKKYRISHHRKVQNKNFSVTSKNHLSINFLTLKKDHISNHRKIQNKNFPVISKHHISVNGLSQEKIVFPISKKV